MSRSFKDVKLIPVMMNIKALLFDFDGTLVDTESLHFNSWNDDLSLFSVSLTPDVYAQEFSGVSIVTNAKNLIKRCKLDISLETLVAWREDTYINKIRNSEIPLMPYVKETLDFFTESGISLGLVTSSSRTEVDSILEKIKLQNYFKVLVTRDDVKSYKPDPAPYIKSIKSFGFEASSYLVFEDFISGIRSAKAANLSCLAINAKPFVLVKLKTEADYAFHNLQHAKNTLLKITCTDV